MKLRNKKLPVCPDKYCILRENPESRKKDLEETRSLK